MAVIIQTSEPKLLLDNFRRLITRGIIKTWIFDDDGDFTSSNFKWVNKAWFEPRILPDDTGITFGIVSSLQYPMTKELYAVYHGRLVTTLVAHFDTILESCIVTPLADINYDKIS